MVSFNAWRYLSKNRSIPCPAWLAKFVELDNPFTKYNQANEIIKLAQVKPKMHCIDFGCGPGRITIPLAKQVKHVTAIDLQEKMLEKVKRKAIHHNCFNITLLQANLGSFKIKTAFCERAFLINVLGELPNQIAALKEIKTIIKDDGILVIAETKLDPHYQRPAKLKTTVERAGLQVLNVHGNKLSYVMLAKKIKR